MFETDNKRIIHKFIHKSIRSNLTRNVFLVISVILVSVLLTIIFGTGLSMFRNFDTAQTRFAGTTANGILPNPTAEQSELLQELDYVEKAGHQQYTGHLTDESTSGLITLTYYDNTEWNAHIIPTLGGISGSYPQNENEIMLSKWCLNHLEINSPFIGETVTLEFQDAAGNIQTETFHISGYFEDFLSLNASGSYGNTMGSSLYFSNQQLPELITGNIAVSAAFADTHGIPAATTAFFNIADKNMGADEALAKLGEDLSTSEVIVAGLNHTAIVAVSSLLLVILFTIFVIICGYLLIYNISYISVVRDMHTFGQLKTLGATARQIRKIVLGQSLLVAAVGIPLGLIIGGLLSLFAVPAVLNALLTGNDFGPAMPTSASMSPILFVFAVLFTLLVILFSSLKPARLAANVSPAEAVRYQENTSEKSGTVNSGSGGKLHRMAFRNVFRSKKRAFITFLSLFMGLLIFLIVNILTYGLDFNVRYERELPYTVMLSNDTMDNEDAAVWNQVFTDEIMEQLENISGIESREETWCGTGTIMESDDIAPYLQYRTEYAEPDEIYNALSISLDWHNLSKFQVTTTLSEDELKELMASGKGLFLEPIDHKDASALLGKEITISGDSEASYIIAGILENVDGTSPYIHQYYNYAPRLGGYPYGHLYMTPEGLERSTTAPLLQQLRMDTSKENEPEVNAVIDKILADNTSIKKDSQLDLYELYAPAVDSLKIIGTIFSLFLLFLGLTNFVNVIVTNIFTRSRELAALESIGMTTRQIRKTLTMEGLYYTLFTLLLLGTLGTALAFGILSLAKNVLYYFVFGFPVVPLAVLLIVLCLICAVVPNLVYRSIARESIIERLKKGLD